MNKILALIITGIFLISSAFWLHFRKINKSNNQFTVGILQTASHPALDMAREGFIATLKKEFDNNISFIIHNFEGNPSNGLMMAQALQNNKKINCIFAIATPAAQLMLSIEKKRPICIAAVTNPHILTENKELPKNLFGSTDMIDIKSQVTAIKNIFPNIRNIAILFNLAEANSIFLRTQMQQAFTEAGFTIKEVGITSEAELGNQVKHACNNIDLLIAPTDNLVATAAGFIASICLAKKTPFMVSDPLLVKNGPLLAAGGVDYKKSGCIVGVMAAKKLRNEPLSKAFEKSNQSKIIVNKTTMQALNLNINTTLVDLVD